MANERTYPALPCRDVEESVAFYVRLKPIDSWRRAWAIPVAMSRWR